MVGVTARDLYLPVAAQPTLEDIVTLAENAEALGYDRLWLPETWGREAATVLAVIAERTTEIGTGTSVANVYSRSPALLGQLAATQQEATDGRFRLGVGPSGPALVEGWHGMAYEEPLKRTRETIEVVRRVLTGDPVNYDGTSFTLAGFRLRCDPPETPPPIDAAGLGPHAVELAGRFANGWHALTLTPDGFRDRYTDFQRGCELAGRDPLDRRVTLAVTCCALDDPGRARALVAGHLAFYCAAMGPFYRRHLARQGFEETGNAIAATWQDDREKARRLAEENLLGELGASGTPAEARAALERYEQLEGVDAVNVAFPREATPDEIRATMRALSPAV